MASEEIASNIRTMYRVCRLGVCIAYCKDRGYKPEFVINALNGRV